MWLVSWLLDQGVSALNLLSGEYGVKIGIEFPATLQEETLHERISVLEPVAPSSVTSRYYTVKTDRLMPVVDILDESTQADVFTGKAIYCTGTEFVAVLTDQQLFADSEETAGIYSSGPSGLMLKGSLDPDTTDIALTISTMTGEMGDQSAEEKTIYLPVFKTFVDVGPYVPLTNFAILEEVGTVSKMMSAAVYNAPQVMSDLYVQAGDALYDVPGKVQSAWKTAGETYESVKKAESDYSTRLAQGSAKGDQALLNAVSDLGSQVKQKGKDFAEAVVTFSSDMAYGAGNILGRIVQFGVALAPEMASQMADSTKYYQKAIPAAGQAVVDIAKATPGVIAEAAMSTGSGLVQLGSWLGGYVAEAASPLANWVSSIMEPGQGTSNETAFSSTAPVNMSTATVTLRESEVSSRATVFKEQLFSGLDTAFGIQNSFFWLDWYQSI